MARGCGSCAVVTPCDSVRHFTGHEAAQMAQHDKDTIGVVGLGNMGGAFARHLAAAGWPVLGFDIDTARKRAATRAGIEIAPDVATLAAAAPVMILSLPSPQALDATVAAISRDKLPSRIVVEAGTFK